MVGPEQRGMSPEIWVVRHKTYPKRVCTLFSTQELAHAYWESIPDDIIGKFEMECVPVDQPRFKLPGHYIVEWWPDQQSPDIETYSATAVLEEHYHRDSGDPLGGWQQQGDMEGNVVIVGHGMTHTDAFFHARKGILAYASAHPETPEVAPTDVPTVTVTWAGADIPEWPKGEAGITPLKKKKKAKPMKKLVDDWAAPVWSKAPWDDDEEEAQF